MIHTSIAGCRIIGRLAVGNRHGLVLPSSTTDQELQHVRNSLPDAVNVRRVDDRLSALGNIVACNDHVALVHPDLDRETEEVLGDVLKERIINNSFFLRLPDYRHHTTARSSVGYTNRLDVGALLEPWQERLLTY